MNANMDQLQAHLTDLAPVLRAYMLKLIKEGFTTSQAFLLTKHMQDSIMGGAMNGSDKA